MIDCKYAIPSHWDIGKVYKRLIKQVAKEEKIGIIDALIKVYNSFLAQRSMIITVVCTMKILHTCLSVIGKTK